MKTPKHLVIILLIIALGFSFMNNVKAQVPQEDTQAFLDFTAFGIRIQANATASARPAENITFILTLTSQVEVRVDHLNVSIFGFLNGTDRVLMSNQSDNDFWLNNTMKSYNWSFLVPESVSGKAYGEIRLAHSAIYGPTKVDYEEFPCGFYMTDVENVYLEELEQQYNDLTQEYNQLSVNYSELMQNYNQLGNNYSELMQEYDQLNTNYSGLTQKYDQLNTNYSGLTQKYDQLNVSYGVLQQNLTDALLGNANELDSTRRVATVFGITTAFFVATTLYLVLRKPKEYW